MSLATLFRQRTATARDRRACFGFDALETRSLLSASSFTAPSNLASILRAAHQGRNETAPIVTAMLQTLQTELTDGPLTELGTTVAYAESQLIFQPESTVSSSTYESLVNGDSFLEQVRGVIVDYDHVVSSRIGPVSIQSASILDEQGTSLMDTLTLQYNRYIAGLNPSFNFADASYEPYYYLKYETQAIRQLTESRPLWPEGTPALSFYQQADVFRNDIALLLIDNLESPSYARMSLTIADAETTAKAEAVALEAGIAAANTATGLKPSGLSGSPEDRAIHSSIQRACRQFESTVDNVAKSASSSQLVTVLQSALNGFNTKVFAAEGLFGSGGPLSDRFQAPTNDFEPNFTSDPIASNANSNYSKIYTFANAKATRTTLRSATTVYRFYSDNPNPPQSPTEPIREDNYFGAYYTTQAYDLGVQAIQMLALDQSWYHPNLATMMRAETWPAEQAVVMGTVASIPQGILRPALTSLYPGGGQQVLKIQPPGS